MFLRKYMSEWQEYLRYFRLLGFSLVSMLCFQWYESQDLLNICCIVVVVYNFIFISSSVRLFYFIGLKVREFEIQRGYKICFRFQILSAVFLVYVARFFQGRFFYSFFVGVKGDRKGRGFFSGFFIFTGFRVFLDFCFFLLGSLVLGMNEVRA